MLDDPETARVNPNSMESIRKFVTKTLDREKNRKKCTDVNCSNFQRKSGVLFQPRENMYDQFLN